MRYRDSALTTSERRLCSIYLSREREVTSSDPERLPNPPDHANYNVGQTAYYQTRS
ncbi:MAG TPA: hypothetical protein VFA46_13510 [Actinomycetes bacterium]|nr:hypothetical protein [Actinomycetes bacterium]